MVKKQRQDRADLTISEQLEKNSEGENDFLGWWKIRRPSKRQKKQLIIG